MSEILAGSSQDQQKNLAFGSSDLPSVRFFFNQKTMKQKAVTYERGKIRHEAFAKQQVRWPTMRWGNITPTDIDGAIDFGNKLFLFFEVKHISTNINTGQRLLLERLCKRINDSGSTASALVAQHGQVDEYILLENCILAEYWYNDTWHKPKTIVTITECVNELYKRHVKPF